MNARSMAQPQKATTPTFTPVRCGLLQRKRACGGTPDMTGECEGGSKNWLLQRATRNSEAETRKADSIPPIVDEVLRSPGPPLDPTTRAFMESRFGHDFSQVRVHSDAKAAESARAVNALAYTVGRDIVFGAGQYGQGWEYDGYLLAHELVHTMQQSQSGGVESLSPSGLRLNEPHDSYEKEADRLAAQVMFASMAPREGVNPVHTDLAHPGLYLARVDCSTVPQRLCKGIYSCGYGGSGKCYWGGEYPNKRCMCFGEQRREPPSPSRVLEVLAILGLSLLLVVTVIAALLDPEPATKLGLAGLSAAEAVALLLLLGYSRQEIRDMGLDPDLASRVLPGEERAA
jgi:hypothetical protein